VFSFLFELGVSCIHLVYYGLRPSALFEIYFIYKKIKRQGLARGSNLERFLAKVDVKHKQPNTEMRKSRKNRKKALKRSFVRQSRSRNAVDDMSS
jgi:hypothetical protein